MSNLYLYKLSFQNLKNALVVGFNYRDIYTAPQDEWKEATKKSTRVEKRGNKAREKYIMEMSLLFGVLQITNQTMTYLTKINK